MPGQPKGPWETMPENQFVMQVDRASDELRVRICGDLDGRTTPQLRAVLNRAVRTGAADVCLDLTDVGAFDAAALATIVTSGRRLVGQDRCLSVHGLTGLQGRLLEICDDQRTVKITN